MARKGQSGPREETALRAMRYERVRAMARLIRLDVSAGYRASRDVGMSA
jgi:hypothetical protein